MDLISNNSLILSNYRLPFRWESTETDKDFRNVTPSKIPKQKDVESQQAYQSNTFRPKTSPSPFSFPPFPFLPRETTIKYLAPRVKTQRIRTYITHIYPSRSKSRRPSHDRSRTEKSNTRSAIRGAGDVTGMIVWLRIYLTDRVILRLDMCPLRSFACCTVMG